MEENMQHFWHIMLYYFKEGKNTTEMQKRICAVCGEGAVTDPMCQKWFAKILGTIEILAKFFAMGLFLSLIHISEPTRLS